MKAQRVEVLLNLTNNQEYVTVNGREGKRTTESLLEYLRTGIKKQSIKLGNKVVTGSCTRYIFNVYTHDSKNDKDIKSLFVLKVRNEEKNMHYTTLKSIDDLCELSAQIKKTNRIRVIAGISAGLFILVAAGPSIGRGLLKLSEKEYEYDQQRYSQYTKSNVDQPLTDDQIQEAKDSYYKDLEQRAKQGDKEAIEEYSQYLLEQQLEEQAKENGRAK